MNSYPNSNKLRILICPLDWGLGHATRCIPIIRELVTLDCEVVIAADKLTFSLLNQEFPSLHFISLQGYHVKYSQDKKNLPFTILSQIPKLIKRIRMEKKWLQKVIAEYKIDGVISDNRFGLHSPGIPCVYITHQLAIQTGSAIGDYIAQRIHYYFIKKYQQCWIPDFEEGGLAGKLSHPKKMPANVTYIGALSRFQLLTGIEKKYDFLFLISGPEPQRTIFEEIILSCINELPGNILIVRGLPSSTKCISLTDDKVSIENHLSAASLNKAIHQSKLVISRSGYTTIMDLVKLGAKAMLVPTPGQTEQEYLAKYLHSKGYFYSVSPEKFSLKEEINKAAKFAYQKPEGFEEIYKGMIKNWLLELKEKAEKNRSF